MKGLSCNSGLLCKFSTEEAINILAAHGYQGIDISLEIAPPFLPMPPPHMSPEDDASTRRRVRRAAEQAGITIVALNAHNNLIHSVPETRQANLEFVREALQLASDLEVKCVVAGSGMKEFYGWESQYWEWMVVALRELVTEADRLGISLAVEAGGLPGILVHNLSRMQRLLEYDGLESLGVLFDPSHYYIRGDAVPEAFKALSERVAHVHAKDAKGYVEDYAFPPLGMGEIDFEALVRAMVESNYLGYVSVEYEAFAWGYDMEATQVLSEGKALLDGIISAATR